MTYDQSDPQPESAAADERAQRAVAVPPGFRPLPFDQRFIGRNGPIFLRRDADGVIFGFPVEERHTNPLGVAHGGWLATCMDMALPLGARFAADGADHYMLTISLTLDYLNGAPRGCWAECRPRVLRRTGRMVFVEGVLTVAGAPVLRGSGIFRIGPPGPPGELDSWGR